MSCQDSRTDSGTGDEQAAAPGFPTLGTDADRPVFNTRTLIFHLGSGAATGTVDYTVAESGAGRLSMKELTENTARPGPGGP